MAANQTRNAFFRKIGEMMNVNENIVIVSVDLAGPPFDTIRKDYPERYIGVGIAEQNSVAIACGLASEGKKVIVYAANPFPFLRAFDQIRNCACTMFLPITIVGLGTGFSVAECGTTHLTLEDIALASLCAGLDTYSVSDMEMAEYLANQIPSFTKPTYIRFGKWSGDPVGSFNLYDFNCGYRKVKEGDCVAVVGTGDTVQLLMNMDLPVGFAVYDWFKLSESNKLCKELSGFDRIVTVEEQIRRGGMGSILLESFNDFGLCKSIHRIGVDLPYGYPQEYGDRDYWLNKFSITREHIISTYEGKNNET